MDGYKKIQEVEQQHDNNVCFILLDAISAAEGFSKGAKVMCIGITSASAVSSGDHH